MGGCGSCLRRKESEERPAQTPVNSFVVKRQYAATKRVEERIALVLEALRERDEFERTGMPGLLSLLEDYVADEIENDAVDLTRRILKVFRDADIDQTYQNLLSPLTDTERSALENFVSGSSAEAAAEGFQRGPSRSHRDELARLASLPRAHISAEGVRLEGTDHQGFRDFATAFSWLFEDLFVKGEEQHHVTIYKQVPFRNRSGTVRNSPRYTFVPSTVAGIQRIVRFAGERNLSVRCAGFRNSLAPVFGRDGQVLILMRSLGGERQVPEGGVWPLPEPVVAELETVEPVGDVEGSEGERKLVRVAAAVSLGGLGRWCGENRLALPFDSGEVEVTVGGAVATMYLGGGRRSCSLDDLVRKVEYVDAHGEVREVVDPEHLRVAGGCFGLMGVVTHLTIELGRGTHAVEASSELRVPVVEAIPPPPDMSEELIPPVLCPEKPLSEVEKRRAQEAFEQLADDDQDIEWSWFPYDDYVWINSRSPTTGASGLQKPQSDLNSFLLFIEDLTLHIMQSSPLLDILSDETGITEAGITLISLFAGLRVSIPGEKNAKSMHASLPRNPVSKTLDQHGCIRNLTVHIPLQPRADQPDKVDYTVVQRAWWDAIVKAHKCSDECPQRLPLKMRITGGSGMIMAPQRGTEMATCSIEIGTAGSAVKPVGLWKCYAQEVLKKWTSYKGAEGERLKVRPAWGREWYQFAVEGERWLERLKFEDCREDVSELKRVLARIGEGHNWTLEDLRTRFSNEMLDEFIFDERAREDEEEKGMITDYVLW